jgi:pimeloyl-ACP methyl ester carboxylesterase
MPVRIQIPTLILSGETDPITPPRFARDTARALGSTARWLRFPITGHGVAGQSECARSIMGEFLDNPDSTPDVRCAAQGIPVRFE